MVDLVKKLNSYPSATCKDEDIFAAAERIERLLRYEELIRFIASDYHELSYDKAVWQRDDWKKRCERLIDEDHAGDSVPGHPSLSDEF